MSQAIAEIGHNNPPSDIDIFGEKVKAKYPEMFSFAERLLATEAKLPTEVNDDETCGKVSDFVKQVQTAMKNLDAARKSEKEEYLEAGRRVDGFFKNRYIDKLEKLKNTIANINAVYLKRKEDEERRIREEKAEELRIKAAKELEEANRKAEEARKAQEAAEAESRRIADEAGRRQREIEAEAERKRKEQQAEIDRLNAEKAQQDKVDAETKAKLKEAEDKLKQINKDEKADLKEVKADVKQAESAVADLTKAARLDTRESNRLLDTAARTEKQAVKMEKLADASAADIARVRGDEGALATIKTEWVGTLTDRSALDLEALRGHFHENDLQIAINSWVKANPGRQLKGAYVREETKAMVR